MQQKPLYRYIFDQLDFAEAIQDKITPESPITTQYLMTLIYIEDILDSYGRDLIHENGRDAGLMDDEISDLMSQANRRMDALRGRIRSLIQTDDYAAVVKQKCDDMTHTWRKWTDEEYKGK